MSNADFVEDEFFYQLDSIYSACRSQTGGKSRHLLLDLGYILAEALLSRLFVHLKHTESLPESRSCFKRTAIMI